MKLRDAMVLWTPKNWQSETAGQVVVIRHGDIEQTERYAALRRHAGASGAEWEVRDDAQRALALFMLIDQLVRRDGLDPAKVSEALLEVDEYREYVIRSEGLFWNLYYGSAPEVINSAPI